MWDFFKIPKNKLMRIYNYKSIDGIIIHKTIVYHIWQNINFQSFHRFLALLQKFSCVCLHAGDAYL